MVRIVELDEAEVIGVIATRMRATLAEVIGAAEGEGMYAIPWLEDRVRFHLDGRCEGSVAVAEEDGEVVGHTIVRLEPDGVGLVSTTYVVPSARRRGVAQALLTWGEGWLRAQGAAKTATNTAAGNTPLIRMYEANGYQITLRSAAKGMVRLTKVW